MPELSDFGFSKANGMFPMIEAWRIGKIRLCVDSMEEELRQNLTRCATAFTVGRAVSMATLGRLAAGDWRFFERLNDDAKTFTARKYDEAMRWFSNNWPAEAVWPEEIARPIENSKIIREEEAT